MATTDRPLKAIPLRRPLPLRSLPKPTTAVQTTEDRLDYYDDLNKYLEDLQARRQRALDAALPAAVRQKLKEIDEQYHSRLAEAVEAISQVEGQVKAEVLEAGETVRGARWMAVYVKGRSNWNTDKLEGYGAAHPEILEFRKKGEPSVTFRKVKEPEAIAKPVAAVAGK